MCIRDRYVNFNICEADIEDDETVLAMTDQFDASEKTVKVLKSVKYGKKTLKEGTDYTVSLVDPKGESVEIVKGQAKLNQPGEYLSLIHICSWFMQAEMHVCILILQNRWMIPSSRHIRSTGPYSRERLTMGQLI